MPQILDHLVKKLIKKGYPEDQAWAIATSQLQKRGLLKKGTQDLTKKGKKVTT